MKQKASFFNSGISKNILKRCWPLWVCWFAVLAFALPVSIQNSLNSKIYMKDCMELWFEQQVLNSGLTVVEMSFIAAVAAAMAVFSFLYSSRSCGMMCSLPVTREALFTTCWLTGLIPIAVAELLVALLSLALFGSFISAVTLLKWLGLALLGTLAFYGFACFCAMLTGSLFILPLVYAVLSFTAAVVNSTLNDILCHIVYGYVGNGDLLSRLSPPLCISRMHSNVDYAPNAAGEYLMKGPVTVSGMPYLFVLAALGLVFSALALLLFKKRKMETASDTVAIYVLKPVFKYCMAFGTALVFCDLAGNYCFTDSFAGPGRAAADCGLMLMGGLIGYYSALMMIKKTLRVFREDRKGLLIVWAVLIVFSLGAEFNLTGYETRLPEISEVESFDISSGYSSSTIKDKENLQRALELHRSIIANKAQHETAGSHNTVYLTWNMKDGSVLSRSYNINISAEQLNNPDADALKLIALEGCTEAVLSRCKTEIPITPDNIKYASFWYYGDYSQLDPQLVWLKPVMNPENILSSEEAYALYTECILPDIMAGRIGNSSWLDSELGLDRSTCITVYFELRSGLPENGAAQKEESFYMDVLTDSELTLGRLRQLADTKD